MMMLNIEGQCSVCLRWLHEPSFSSRDSGRLLARSKIEIATAMSTDKIVLSAHI